MPIVFAQPEPVSPAISQGAGQAEQWSRDLPSLIAQQNTLAQQYMHASSLRAQGAQQAMQLAAGIQGQNAQAQAAANAQGQQQQHQMQMLQAQQTGQAGLQQQHGDIQQQLMTTELSQREGLRLRQLKDALGEVQDRVTAGTLTPEQGQDMFTRLKTGIDPLQQRQAAAAQQHVELQNQQLQRQTAAFDQLQHQRTQFQASTLDQRRGSIIDDNGDEHDFILGHDGGIDHHATQLLQGRNRVNPTGGEGGGSGTGSRNGGGSSLNPQQLANVHHQVNQEMTAQARPPAGGWPAGQSGPAWAATPEAWKEEADVRVAARSPQENPGEADRRANEAQRTRITREVNLQYRNLPREERAAIVEGRLSLEGQASGVLQERRQAEDAIRRQITQQASQMPNNPLTGQPLSEGTRARIISDAVRERMRNWQPASARNAQQQPTAQPVPFPMTNDNGPNEGTPTVDRERLNPAQRIVQDRIDLARRRVEEFVPEGSRGNFTYAIDRLERLRHEYGADPAAMPPDIHQQFLRYAAIVNRIPDRATPRRAVRYNPRDSMTPQQIERLDMRATSGGL